MNGELDDNEDGIHIITTPKFIVDLGIEEENVAWKLSNALYGLKRSPKKWGLTRNGNSKKSISTNRRMGATTVSNNAHMGNVWNVIQHQPEAQTFKLDGLTLLDVDDTFMLAPILTIQATMEAIDEHWE